MDVGGFVKVPYEVVCPPENGHPSQMAKPPLPLLLNSILFLT